MRHATWLLGPTELSAADADMAAFALFAADVIRGEGIGMDMEDVVAAFRATGTADRAELG